MRACSVQGCVDLRRRPGPGQGAEARDPRPPQGAFPNKRGVVLNLEFVFVNLEIGFVNLEVHFLNLELFLLKAFLRFIKKRECSFCLRHVALSAR